MRVLWLVIFLLTLWWSAVNPKDRPTWWLEAGPAMLGFGVLVWTRNTFPLTPLLYVLILALLGAVVALTLGRLHDRQLEKL